ncbi:single-stranded DNA-binding protein [Kocuria sp.]|uniref:single-stranded DNA-binding protein n=1 Tax=Kocuria sp. TaxID=1871328 RepID=UPI0026DCD317|nr:single-stranded DNA-binding protein [Kocuria sp.]MDO4918467.1 single-stranded DNA-binding protein [Kocuria sp.]
MSEHITLRGFVGKDPESRLFEDGTMVARFRLATTTRRFDAATNSWHDTSTNWYTVRCFRALAMHVMASVRCGHPVVVTGKLGINEWQSETGPRTVVQVDATAVGHDLSFGTANFSRSGGRSQRAEAGDGARDASSDGERGAGEGNGVERGASEQRYRSSQALGLEEESFVDLESGAVLAVAGDDDTFRNLTGTGQDTGPGAERAQDAAEHTAEEDDAVRLDEDRAPVAAAR